MLLFRHLLLVLPACVVGFGRNKCYCVGIERRKTEEINHFFIDCWCVVEKLLAVEDENVLRRKVA